MIVPDRHLTPSLVLAQYAASVATVYPYEGRPAVSLLIDGNSNRFVLYCEWSGPAESLEHRFKHLTFSRTRRNGVNCIEISVDSGGSILDAHAIYSSIADLVQLEQQDPIRATLATLEHWRSALAMRTRLTASAEIGLFGELLLLKAAVAELGPSALPWRGSFGEEHDFDFGDVDAEVKTTSTESRVHWISSTSQLEQTGARPLVLISIQLTRAGASGTSLPDLIEHLRRTTSTDLFEARLSSAGWVDDDRDLFTQRWRLRSPPAAFEVDSQFPRITPRTLVAGGTDVNSIAAVRYQVDLANRPPSTFPPGPLASVLSRLSDEQA